ncbi:DinB family protein [Chryseobacterium fluminis]|uniref:DinB family protein n=1 Tax=Chryseobacterium fluminis TaxID=2983606 RepID=UPI00225556DF|nr:DinB family protein [Chryseobacterium sp. MMS21-Ot14]UZT96025.1 DinB family protein [Chryseobacterium sp. MMS21-Ot14]
MKNTKQLTLQEIKNALQSTQENFLKLSSQSLLIEKLYTKPSPAEWSCGIVLWHIGEARTFFANEIEKVLHHTDLPIGRTMDDPVRLANIKEADIVQPSIDKILDRLEKSYSKVTTIFKNLKPSDLEIEIQHMNPKFGLMKLVDFIDHFIVEHDHIHLAQIDRILKQIR